MSNRESAQPTLPHEEAVDAEYQERSNGQRAADSFQEEEDSVQPEDVAALPKDTHYTISTMEQLSVRPLRALLKHNDIPIYGKKADLLSRAQRFMNEKNQEYLTFPVDSVLTYGSEAPSKSWRRDEMAYLVELVKSYASGIKAEDKPSGAAWNAVATKLQEAAEAKGWPVRESTQVVRRKWKELRRAVERGPRSLGGEADTKGMHKLEAPILEALQALGVTDIGDRQQRSRSGSEESSSMPSNSAAMENPGGSGGAGGGSEPSKRRRVESRTSASAGQSFRHPAGGSGLQRSAAFGASGINGASSSQMEELLMLVREGNSHLATIARFVESIHPSFQALFSLPQSVPRTGAGAEGEGATGEGGASGAGEGSAAGSEEGMQEVQA